MKFSNKKRSGIDPCDFKVGDLVVADGSPDFGNCIFKFEEWMFDFIDIHLRHATINEISQGYRDEYAYEK